ncbi:nuclear transport factor 2 family protein [Sphingobium yanoikuyae]|uniref:nuclear transport factor 2 family protein n=1 Tax=Sphingobium yanoikuyae TaxID=13690 RepID=UPI0028B0F35B|nr:nuclear transport factor 2 family protein [Sphingobium yanoikuyae]
MIPRIVRKRLIETIAIAGGLTLACMASATPAAAQDTDLAARIGKLEDEAALKRLVDTFSNLADRKDIDTQVTLFTEDATVDSWVDGKKGSSLKGRAELASAFGGFLAQFSTVYHMNGQQTVTIQGDEATGTAYCLVVLVSQSDGKTIRRTSGVRYDDRYERRNGQWLIAARTSHFEWTAIEELPA